MRGTAREEEEEEEEEEEVKDEAERTRRHEARAQRAAIPQSVQKQPPAAMADADVEAQRAALPEQLQGHLAGQDLAPPTRPRRPPKPRDRLVEHDDACPA